MSRKTPAADMDKAVELYLSGKTGKEAAAIVGISSSPLVRELQRRGLARSRRIDVADVVPAYLAGESVLSISNRTGVSRAVIDRHLREAGVEKRTASEQNRIEAAKQTRTERLARASAAHAALRGKPADETTLEAAARTREAHGTPQSAGEADFLRWLQERGETPTVQAAIKRYNVDLALADIAVEVLGGEWHASKRRHGTRTKVILDTGWHVLFVWDTPMFPVESAAADYAVAFAQEARRDPASTREYRVIRGDGEFIAKGSLENYDLTLIPPARHGMSTLEAARLGGRIRWAGHRAKRPRR